MNTKTTRRISVSIVGLTALVMLCVAAGAAMPQPGGRHQVTSERTYDSGDDQTTVTYKLKVGSTGVRDFHLVLPKGMRMPKNATTSSTLGAGFSVGSVSSDGRSVHWTADHAVASGAEIDFSVTVSGNKMPAGKSPYWAVTTDGSASSIRTLAHIKTKSAVSGWGPGTGTGTGPADDLPNGPLIPPPGLRFARISQAGAVAVGGSLQVDLASSDGGADYALYISEDVVPSSTDLPFGVTLTWGEGTLSTSGDAVATLTVSNDPGLAGKVLYATLVIFDASGDQDLVGEPVAILID